jgi:anion-transporting  ArsA/GET3 family ATPase
LDPGAFCAQARLLIVAGKGGVGKTTITAALARLAARTGRNALIIDVEGKSGLGAIFGYYQPLTYREVVLDEADGPATGEIRARTLTADDALLEYLSDHGMHRISKRLAGSGALDVVATAAPGIKDILVLGKVKQLERASFSGAPGAADLLILDAPAAGHAFTFLTSAQALMDAVSVGPIRSQATEVLDLLSDPTRCQVMLVTLPEETPVNEVVETAFKLEDKAGVHLTPIVVNGLYPELDLDRDPAKAAVAAGVAITDAEVESLRRAAAFRVHRQELQAHQAARLAEALPLSQLHLPFLFTTELGRPEVDQLADALAAELAKLPDPDPVPAPAATAASAAAAASDETVEDAETSST